MSERFRSRIDAVVAVVLVTPVAVVAWTLIGVARRGGESLMVPALVCAVTTGLILWLLLDTSYTVTDTELRIRGGPMRVTLPLASIRRVRRSNTLISAPALSLRRLEIDYGSSGLAVISPAREAEFLALIRARVPQVELPSIAQP